ncbi:XRE family transcriptional regulator [bacterium]|nr:MAG: XRE family transcriptional regulator [bacterium]
MNVAKYFWDLNKKALGEAKNILKKPNHAKFPGYMVTLLSRCDKPKELFSLMPEDDFIEAWPSIRSYWVRAERRSEFRDWWQTIYEQLLEEGSIRNVTPKGEAFYLLKEIGGLVRRARINKRLSQKELSVLTGVKQPEISKIEEGKKNITIATLSRFCKALDIRQINL